MSKLMMTIIIYRVKYKRITQIPTEDMVEQMAAESQVDLEVKEEESS